MASPRPLLRRPITNNRSAGVPCLAQESAPGGAHARHVLSRGNCPVERKAHDDGAVLLEQVDKGTGEAGLT